MAHADSGIIPHDASGRKDERAIKPVIEVVENGAVNPEHDADQRQLHWSRNDKREFKRAKSGADVGDGNPEHSVTQ